MGRGTFDLTERERAHSFWILWLVAIGSILLALGFGGWTIYDMQRGTVPPFSLTQGGVKTHGRVIHGLDPSILMAGSGSNLPLTRELIRAFQSHHPGPRMELAPSIGSTGGILAVEDRAVPIGLISRPLTPQEEKWNLSVIPYARSAVVFATHLSVPDRQLAMSELLDIYQGSRQAWSDGRPIVVLQREQGDSSHAAIHRVFPAFAKVNENAYRQKRWRVLYSDAEMQAALLATPGAIGLMDLGSVLSQNLPLQLQIIDGAKPSLDLLHSGRYPFFKDLAFVTAATPGERFEHFLDFVYSDQGRPIIEAAGYLPLSRTPP